MNNAQTTIDRIKAAYAALDVLNDIDHRHVRDTLYAKCVVEERGHRRGNKGEYKCSADVAAKMFVVRDLAALVSGARLLPPINALLYMKDSFTYAAAIAATYPTQIKLALDPHNTGTLAWLAALDYVRLVNGVAQ